MGVIPHSFLRIGNSHFAQQIYAQFHGLLSRKILMQTDGLGNLLTNTKTGLSDVIGS